MKDTILIIPAWHRPEYFSRCLQSWGAARGVQDLRRITVRLAPSPYAPEMMDIAAAARRNYGLPVHVVPDDPEDALIKGPDMALGKEINTSFEDQGCDFVIECDEDIIVSDDILDYMAWARQLDPEPACVCAHNDFGQGWSPDWDDSGADQETVQVRGEFTSWCFGISRAAWTQVWGPQWDWTRTSGGHPAEHGWEWQMHRQANAGVMVAVPDASRCLNIGQHGGTFSNPAQFPQAKSFREHRDPVPYRLAGGE